jgi:hypothetical protein
VVSAADSSRSLISVFYIGASTFLSSSSSFMLTRLSGLVKTNEYWYCLCSPLIRLRDKRTNTEGETGVTSSNICH